jgi:hypothetical protein
LLLTVSLTPIQYPGIFLSSSQVELATNSPTEHVPFALGLVQLFPLTQQPTTAGFIILGQVVIAEQSLASYVLPLVQEPVEFGIQLVLPMQHPASAKLKLPKTPTAKIKLKKIQFIFFIFMFYEIRNK